MADEWITVHDAATRLHINPATVRRWLREGRLRGVSFGGPAGWRIRRQDFDDFMQRQGGRRVTSETDAPKIVNEYGRYGEGRVVTYGERTFVVEPFESQVEDDLTGNYVDGYGVQVHEMVPDEDEVVVGAYRSEPLYSGPERGLYRTWEIALEKGLDAVKDAVDGEGEGEE